MVDKDCIVRELGSRLSPRGRVAYLFLGGEIVTWKQLKDRCGFSDNDVWCAWRNLISIGLAEGDITCGREGMIFDRPVTRKKP